MSIPLKDSKQRPALIFWVAMLLAGLLSGCSCHLRRSLKCWLFPFASPMIHKPSPVPSFSCLLTS